MKVRRARMQSEVIDDRFYTPRATANSSRSQHSQQSSFATPRSSRSTSSGDSSSYRTPRSTFSSSRRSSRSPAFHSHDRSRDFRRFSSRSQQQSSIVPNTIVGGQGNSRQEYERAEAGLQRRQAEPKVNVFSLVRHGRVGEVEQLLQRGAVQIDVQDDNGNGLLAVACQNGNKKLVKLALRYGADINAVNSSGNTALHFACKYGFGATIGDYLVSKGGDPDIRNKDGLLCTDV